jgi:cysteine-rich repeat protein
MTFWSIVATNKVYTIHFTGSAPQNMRFHLLNSNAGERIILRIYFQTSVRMQVFVGKKFVEDVNLYNGKPKAQLVLDGKWAPNTASGTYEEQQLSLTCPCAFGSACAVQACDTLSNQHGANKYDRTTGYLEILLRGHDIDSFIEIQAMPVVQVSMTVSTSTQDFYKIKDAFLSSLASILGINPTRITIVDIVAGRRRSRRLLGVGAAISLEIAPDPVIGFKQSLSTGYINVLETGGSVNISIVRTVNIIPNCSVLFRVGISPYTNAVAGSEFLPAEFRVNFWSLEVEKIISVPVLNVGKYRSRDATFEISLSQVKSASLGTSSLIIAVQSVYSPPPLPPKFFGPPAVNQISIQFFSPVWTNMPSLEISTILQWGIYCTWNNSFRNLSGNISDTVNPNIQLNGTVLNYSLGGLLPGTESRCQTRIQTSVGWSGWSQQALVGKTLSVCGNGYREWSDSEECDDGNTINQDGCNSNCTVTLGWSCNQVAGKSADTCFSGCGNGVLDGVEVCDDANLKKGDGCSISCMVESGWSCSTSKSSPARCNTTCGDGIFVSSKEQCDDGNKLNGDGCSSVCQIENSSFCTIDPNPPSLKSVCQICGNRKLEGSEVCDDGRISGACAPDCKSVALGWKCQAECFPGPAPVNQPFSPAQTLSSITWLWNFPDSFGSPIIMFFCQLASAAHGPENITVNWTAAVMYNKSFTNSPDSTQQQKFITSDLSAAMQYFLRVRACNSVGCGPFSLASVAVKTLNSPQQGLQQIAELLQTGITSKVPCTSLKFATRGCSTSYLATLVVPCFLSYFVAFRL